MMVAAQKAKEAGVGQAADGIVDTLRRRAPLQLLNMNQLFFVLAVSRKCAVWGKSRYSFRNWPMGLHSTQEPQKSGSACSRYPNGRISAELMELLSHLRHLLS
jgi:hypothetical protein